MARRRRRRRNWNGMELWTGVFIAVYLLFPGFSDPEALASGQATSLVVDYTSISGGKTAAFFLFMAALLVPAGFCLWRELRTRQLRGLTPAQYAALAFLAFTLLSAACSPFGDKAWYNSDAHEAALTVSCYVLLFLAVSRWGAATERLFRVLFWAAAAFCAVCLLQALGGNPLKLYPGSANYYTVVEQKRAGYAGTLGNVDLVSAFLALATPMLLLHTRGQRPRQAWPCWVLAALCLGILFWIRVLCGLVGLLLGGAVCVLVFCPEGKRKRVLLVYGLLAAGGLTALWALDLPVKFLHELHELLHGRFNDSFGSGRFCIWRQMLERVPDRLWTGVGPDAARFAGMRIPRFDELGNAVPEITARITDAHCYPLQILYCQGLPALLSWLILVGLVLTHWWRARRERAAAILGGGLVCFLAAMLFCFSSIIIMPFFWLVLGLLDASTRKL